MEVHHSYFNDHIAPVQINYSIPAYASYPPRHIRCVPECPLPGNVGIDCRFFADCRHPRAPLIAILRSIIMATSPIPKTAPFAEEDIEILNRVVGPATPIQRAWLAGFLAGLVSSSAPQPATTARPTEPLTIVFASESGNSERLAGDMAKAARKQGFKPSVIDMADLDVTTLASVRRLIVIAATWGEGDPPARAVRAYADLMGEKAPRLDGVELAALGGKRVAERADLDLDFAEPAARWIETTLQTLAPATDRGRVIEVDFGAKDAKGAANLDIVEAEITDLINLNSSRSDKQTIHLELAFDGAAPAYSPGDSLDVHAENDPVYLDQFL